ncbi:MAG TPA: 30S ribosome-binding factor RbfA [Anaerolineaceae bacterium]
MPSKIRLQKICDRLQMELASMLVMEINDPRLSGVSVTGVKVDRELAYADIFVSAVEGHERSAEILAGLDHASGFLRKELAARVDLRTFPRLRFHWDPTPEKADHIEKLLASLRQTPQTQPGDEPKS